MLVSVSLVALIVITAIEGLHFITAIAVVYGLIWTAICVGLALQNK